MSALSAIVAGCVVAVAVLSCGRIGYEVLGIAVETTSVDVDSGADAEAGVAALAVVSQLDQDASATLGITPLRQDSGVVAEPADASVIGSPDTGAGLLRDASAGRLDLSVENVDDSSVTLSFEGGTMAAPDAGTVPAVTMDASPMTTPEAGLASVLSDVPSPCAGINGPWTLGEPEHQSALSTDGRDAEPSFIPGGLSLYVTSAIVSSNDVIRYDRLTLTDSFGEGTEAFPDVNNELKLTLSSDGLSGILNVSRGNADLFWVTRRTLDAGWSTPVPIDELNTADNEWDPWLSPDGLRLYYVTDGAGSNDILLSQRTSIAVGFDAPQGFTELNNERSQGNPTLSQNELLLIFSEEPAGGLTSRELYFAVRSARSEPFSTAWPLPVVNDADVTTEAALSPDGCELYFASERAGGLGDLDIYRSLVVAAD